MIVLACETSTLLGSVSLLEDGRILATEESMRQGSHSDVLHPFIQKVLDQAGKKLTDIDLFATGIGPGSFTGIRISLNTVKTLAYCHQKPVYTMNSLESLARAAFNVVTDPDLADQFKNLPIISMINAYKNMCYVSKHQWIEGHFKQLSAPEVVRVQNLESFVQEKSLVCGDGFSTYERFFPQSLSEKLVRVSGVADEPHAITLVQNAYAQKTLMAGRTESQVNNGLVSWNQLLPLYLRASEAEENLKGIKYQPLN